ncbi:MAG: TonB-dependent receptor [Sphingobacteriales bacterium]|nr:MAG: TonB-dependent receptor [Sphingobacteriales bacterium]
MSPESSHRRAFNTPSDNFGRFHLCYENGLRNNPDLRPVADYLFLNPKAGLSYSLSTGTAAHRVYGSLAVANKEPNRDDFEAATTAQPRPEQLYDTELGYEIRKRKWQGAVNAYYMSYKDQLVLTGKINDVGSYARTNVPESYRMGLELMGSVSPFSWLTLEANATLSENKISGFTEYIDNYDDNTQLAIDHGQTDLAFSPGQVYSGILRLKPIQSAKAGTLEVDMLQKHVGRQYLDNTSNLKRSIKPYSITDIRIRYTIRTRFVKELGLSVALNNVFNKLYESNGYTFSYIYGGSTTTQNYYYPQAGFNMLAGVRLKL